MRSNISDKGQNRRKFTILDLLICLVVIAGATYIGMRFFVLEKSDENTGIKYEISFMIEEEKKDIFRVGDEVLTSNGERIIGKITDVKLNSATEIRYNYEIFSDENLMKINVLSENEKQNALVGSVVPLVNEEDLYSETSTQDTSSNISFEGNEEDSNEEISGVFNDEISFEEASEQSEEFVYEELIEGYVIVTVTVEADLECLSGSYYLDGNPIKIDSDIELTTKNYSVKGKCIAIQKSGTEQ